jgi:oligoribonuclease (3'-5' exoribonuclease)
MECIVRDMTGIYVIEKGSVRKVVRQYFRMFRNLLPPSFLITDSNDRVVREVEKSAVNFAKNALGEVMHLKISSHIHSKKDEKVEKNFAVHEISSANNVIIILCEEF